MRKWWRRYQEHGLSGLRERSRAPHRSPQKTSAEIEQQVLALRRQLPTFGAARLKREFDLPVSHMAIQRIWRHDDAGKPTGFPVELRGSQHVRIPPTAHTYQSDVETDGPQPVARGGESRARFTADFTIGVVSLTIPLPHVLVDGSSRRCSWTGSPSTNRRRPIRAVALATLSERFPQIFREYFIFRDRFSGSDGH